MRTTLPTANELQAWAREFETRLEQGVDEARAWLASPQGKEVRALAARLMIVTAPFLVRGRFFKTPVGRLIEVAGGAAFLVKLAEVVRDWEPRVPESESPRAKGLPPARSE
jgi:hypothetical protein